MKTAIQDLIDDLIEQKNFIPALTYGWVMNKVVNLIEKEKKQIEDAFQDGYDECENNAQDRQVRKSTYYDKTFN